LNDPIPLHVLMRRGMNIYFAGSIRGGREDWALYFEIIESLRSYGHVLTEHVGDAGLSPQGEALDDRALHDRDLAWLKGADYLVAEVTRPSLGVGYEIGKATEWGTPVLCLFRPGAGRSLSAMIAGSAGVKVREYGSTSELKSIFEQFFSA
jgi:2'-deoxynucleoside 5'-phosphate N-hydrolase